MIPMVVLESSAKTSGTVPYNPTSLLESAVPSVLFRSHRKLSDRVERKWTPLAPLAGEESRAEGEILGVGAPLAFLEPRETPEFLGCPDLRVPSLTSNHS